MAFIKKNEQFTCLHCGYIVPLHQTSSRDHCTKCLCSLHVDIHPGDRQNICKGLLMPIGIQTKNLKQQIVYKCHRCGQRVLNIIADDDNEEIIREISNLIWS